MIDTIKNICTPSQVYFGINLLIIVFLFFTGKVKENLQKSKKAKKFAKNIDLIMLSITGFSVIFLAITTFILNYICDLGYVNAVGAFVFIYLLYRVYKLKQLFS
jgi:hypothetical protein